jgi:hypothetical protein
MVTMRFAGRSVIDTPLIPTYGVASPRNSESFLTGPGRKGKEVTNRWDQRPSDGCYGASDGATTNTCLHLPPPTTTPPPNAAHHHLPTLSTT